MMGTGKSLELFFVNGKPDEMLTARVFNWTGHVLKTPRTQIRDALERAEAQFTGVYLLLGSLDGIPKIYVGESECIADRIKQHDLKKDWWDDAVLITTTANELNKAHVKYLESRLINLADQAKHSALDNATKPPVSKLSEASTSNMEEFIDILLVALPAIGVASFVNKAVTLAPARPTANANMPNFVLTNKKHGIVARARLADGSFVVLKGSFARTTWEGKGNSNIGGYQSLHANLVANGIIEVSGALGVFKTDYAFDSPSAAAAVCHGRSANGRLDWKVEGTDRNYATWEEIEIQGGNP